MVDAARRPPSDRRRRPGRLSRGPRRLRGRARRSHQELTAEPGPSRLYADQNWLERLRHRTAAVPATRATLTRMRPTRIPVPEDATFSSVTPAGTALNGVGAVLLVVGAGSS